MNFFSFDYNPDLKFDMFTSMHLVMFIAFIGVMILFFLFKDKIHNSKNEKYFRYGLAAILLINEIILIIIEVGAGEVYLPFHLCSISYLLTIALLITNNEKIFVFVFFTGIIGGIVSFAIPEFGNGGYDRFRFYEFIIAHSAIIYVPIYYLTTYKYRINKNRFIRIVIITNILAFSMLGINFILRATNIDPEANYMFTMGPPPEVEGVFGVFPWHIPVFEAVLLVTFFVTYYFGDKYTKKHIN